MIPSTWVYICSIVVVMNWRRVVFTVQRRTTPLRRDDANVTVNRSTSQRFVWGSSKSRIYSSLPSGAVLLLTANNPLTPKTCFDLIRTTY